MTPIAIVSAPSPFEASKPPSKRKMSDNKRMVSRMLTALLASIIVYFLILPASMIVLMSYVTYGWSIHQSALSPDWTQRARVVFQGAGFLDDPEVRLSISGGPADGTYTCLVDEDPSIQRVSSSFEMRWVSNHELHIADQKGVVKDWVIVRIMADGVLVDRRYEYGTAR